MKKKAYLFTQSLLFCTCIMSIQSSHSGVSFGDKSTDLGQLNIGGAIRAKYIYDSESDPSISKFSFSDIIIKLNYDSPKIFGQLDYRLYEYYGRIGDASWLTDAWLGYKINENNKVIVGLNPVPFGPGRYWGNTFYLGTGNTMGLEDVHNLGINYKLNYDKNQFDVAFYPMDGGNYRGKSKDARRFSVNLVDADNYLSEGTNTEEKNMFIMRYAYNFDLNDFKYQVGGSTWYSQIDNKKSGEMGSRKVWALFGNLDYQQWNSKVVLGHQDINNKDLIYPDLITLGAFDYSFNSATKGDFYSAEISYLFKDQFKNFKSIRPYLNVSGYMNKNNDAPDTTRVIPGVSFNFKDITVQAEYLIAKHDPYLGDLNGLSSGDLDKWTKKVYVSIAYYF